MSAGWRGGETLRERDTPTNHSVGGHDGEKSLGAIDFLWSEKKLIDNGKSKGGKFSVYPRKRATHREKKTSDERCARLFQ